ncbi:MAG: GH92 family glycosyl hydrolase [Acidobacteria bacterium]|nr:GH92 family glycosyl hydrolase [Acidobacteriota bacterium]
MMTPRGVWAKAQNRVFSFHLRLKTEATHKSSLLSAPLRLCVLIFFAAAALAAQTKDYTRYVNPFIGTGGHGHTFPGATVPFGMVQLSPDTRIDNWDGSSGYHYSDDIIYGFSHTHLSGTGIPDGCDILITPMLDDSLSSSGMYASKFSHSNEKSEPGYYSVKLDDTGIFAELTATSRVGMHRYTVPSTSASFVVDLNWRDKVLDSDIKVTSTGLEGFRESESWAKKQRVYFVLEFSRPLIYKALINSQTVSEKRDDGTPKRVGLRSLIKFDTKPGEKIVAKVAISYVSIDGARKNLEAELPGWDFDKVRADAKAAWNRELSKIDVSGGTPEQTTNFYTALYHTAVQPNVFNDVDGRYLGHDRKVHQIRNADTPVRNEGRSRNADTPVRMSVASTRTRVNATKFSTGSGSLAGGTGDADKSVRAPSEQYTVFSLWDTFRAAHPLYTIIDQKRTVDFINTFIRIYEQGGRLPVWELWGEETDTMIGYHAVSVIADAMAKGIKGFDYEKAYTAAKHSAELDPFGLAGYKKRGYISMEDENESVSKTLEYAYNDWCIAQMAKIMESRHSSALPLDVRRSSASPKDPNFSSGFAADIELRQSRTDLFGPERKSIAFPHIDGQSPRQLSGQESAGPPHMDAIETLYRSDYQRYLRRARYFENLFDTKTGFFRAKKNAGFVEPFNPTEVNFGFTEGNSWQYSFFVPQDVSHLMTLMGGREKFIAKVDEMFTTSAKLSGREQADLTGLIGQYAHGNEPSHHIAYLYNYAHEPWKTQKYVRQVFDEFYKNAPDGLIGNEDCGQMSAWYIMSAGGFYPVAPGSPVYAFGTPLFPEMTYRLENGKSFTIRAKNVSSKNKYILNAKLNGAPYKKAFITHQDVMRGGVLEFSMIDQPVETAFNEFPVSSIGINTVAVPVITGERTFADNSTVTISTLTPNAKVHFTTDGSVPTKASKVFTAPFNIDRTTTVRAIAVGTNGTTSFPVEAVLTRRPHDWTVKVLTPYSTQYTGGGDNAIIDGIRGTANFASGEWQGVQGKPYEAIIDLKREMEIKELGAGFVQAAGSWIWMPDRIEFDVSDDGINFKKAAEIKPNFPQREMTPTAKEFTQAITLTKARYVRIRAYNFGKIPSWHLGAGGDPWIFVDEVIIR